MITELIDSHRSTPIIDNKALAAPSDRPILHSHDHPINPTPAHATQREMVGLRRATREVTI